MPLLAAVKDVECRIKLKGNIAQRLDAVCNATGANRNTLTNMALEQFLPLLNNKNFTIEGIKRAIDKI